MAAARGGGDGASARDARDILGRIWKRKRNNGVLKGRLSQATYPKDPRRKGSTPENPCEFIHTYHTNVTDGFEKDNPCKNRPAVRFSDVIDGQYADVKIIANNTDTGGACAPLRRIFLCDQHLSHMNEKKINNTHNLLLELSLAAKYEGDSIIENYFKERNDRKGICTALARSFADIGDIVRGKDLFKGYNSKDRKEKVKLQENLKKIFDEIYKKLRDTDARNYYQQDAPNYYKLREDWWALNRKEVWKAITCKAEENDIFSANIKHGETVFSNRCCGHDEGTVLTNLDYVPQYLRWFDEWAEEFCRKKKKYVNIVKNYCRDEAKGKYCSLNGHDCTKTIRKIGDLQLGNGCTECLYACTHYREWLAKQQEEFEKQKKNYTNEIYGRSSQKKGTPDNVNNVYDTKFYDKLKTEYGYVNTFLKLLNKDNECKDINEKEGNINFEQDNYYKTFYRSEYCEMCPECGVDCKEGGCTERKNDDVRCKKPTDRNNRPSNVIPTKINVLYSGNEHKDIAEKLKQFCAKEENKNVTKKEEWECYYRDADKINCKMTGSLQKDNEPPKIMPFYDFFEFWVAHLLNDTIKWESDLKNCINNTNVTNCNNGCNDNCKCFDEWVKQKEKEWENVKKVFENQSTNVHKYYSKLNGIFASFFFRVMHDLKKKKEVKVEVKESQEAKETEESQVVEAKWNQLTAKLEEIIGSSKENTRTGNSQDAIKPLLEYIKETATTCIDNNSLEAGEKCTNTKTNPCGNNPSGSDKVMSVKQLAEMMQREARKQLEENVGEIKLKGDATRGKYKHGGPSEGFKEEKLCKITKDHSNRNEAFSHEPCHKKGTGQDIHTRFEIGTVWKPDPDYSRKDHEEFIIPPRRRHICTSNLEYLQTGDRPLDGKDTDGFDIVNHSFLGDVLLSAKDEANNIIKTYKQKNNLTEEKEIKNANDQATVCRAIRYSFADIGDIIRGRDIWDNETGMKHAKGHLETVFRNIQASLKKKGIKKYDKDGPQYNKLREDWWEANRHQVWRAMKCAIKDGNINNCNGIPIEDYIPQRLRWMSEWAEWYCKFKSDASEKCTGCWENVKRGDEKCKGDTAECEEYNKKIKEWKKQWIDLQTQYKNLYARARVNAFKYGSDNSKVKVEEKDQPVYDFLLDLHLQNGGNVDPLGTTEDEDPKAAPTSIDTMYKNIGAYLYDTGDFPDCKDQEEFCKSGRKIIGPSRPPEATPPAPEEETPVDCTTVKEILKNATEKSSIGECHEKNKNKDYPVWTCDKSSNLVSGDGECMPPRRRKLCLYFLANNKQRIIKNEVELKEAFIKSAAAETFLAWHYYKSKNGDSIETQLKEGTIPPEFLRSMFYTFGDYRDICVDTDISQKVGFVDQAKKKLDAYFDKNPNPDRKKWWTDNAKHIWEAMLCALEKIADNKHKFSGPNSKYQYNKVTFSGSNSPTLETFAQRPQFLRWFTEWGEEFCKKRKEQVEKLDNECKECTISDIDGTCDKNGEGCKQCTKACDEYKRWISTWNEQYRKQKVKFQKEKRTYKDVPDVNNSKNAREYLNKNLEKICENGKCNYTCMNVPSSKNGRDMPDSLDENPKEVKDKCNCIPDECSGLSVKGSKIPDGHAFGGGGPPSYKCQAFKGGDSIPTNCVQKIAYDLWKKGKNETEYVEHLLKGDGMDLKGKCKKLNINEGSENSCDLNTRYPNYIDNLDDQCKDIVMKRLKTGEEWRCKYIKELKADICIPPRREHMCMVKFTNILSSHVKDRKNLLEIVQIIAKQEGDDIIRKLLPENPCNEHVICDAMKYSFADLGDVIRGTDLLRNDSNQRIIQRRLQNAFENIYNNLDKNNKNKYKGDNPHYYILRSDWWDTNRKEVWKAMTCNAPKFAKLYKKGRRTTKTLEGYCDHYNDPPLDDYIPQILRWMTEWSECYCKTLHEKMQEMKTTCDTCKIHNSGCRDDKDGKECVKCKDNCKEYSVLVKKWEEQYNKYYEIYKDLYNNRDKTEWFAINKNYTKTFFEKMDRKGSNNKYNKCKAETADRYLHMTSQCETYEFIKNKYNTQYAFNKFPDGYEEQCTCEITNHPLDKCPDDTNKDVCNNLQPINTCKSQIFNNKLDNWNSFSVDDFMGKNEGVLVPPRRRHLCLYNTIINLPSMVHKNDFKKVFLNAVYTEGKLLWDKYGENSSDVMEAMKYSFADYANIIKGTDMLDTTTSKKINDTLTELLNRSKKGPKDAASWWKNNRTHIWHAMLCGYNEKNPTKVITSEQCTIPNTDKDDQFLRWLLEWAKQACKENTIRKKVLETKCNCSVNENKSYLKILENINCKDELIKYVTWINDIKLYYDGLNRKFQRFKKFSKTSAAVKLTASTAHEYIKAKYPTCDFDFSMINRIYEKFIQEENLAYEEILKYICPKLKFDDPKPEVLPPLPPQSDNTSDILATTLPFGIALALGSIAFLFLKKKTQSPVDLFSVINIPKGDYNIPTLKSSNRYIPYASDRYKGKTYIYMEGDSSGDEKYAFMSDTTDITSSESEYEELDINDIYVPGSPKYKTLIEVVLEPSKRDIQSDDIPHTNKFTDEEWNQLKHDFISNMLQNQPNDVPNDYKSGDIPLNTQPNTLYFDKPEEKPFITSIHDRNLYSGEEYNYNVNMVNNDNIPINRDNNPYSGIDLIIDSLNNNNVDIYDEVLKRKENELFGTNHPKHTNTHNVTKSSNSDPIDNQLDLFHTWLDRHRNMCEQWINKEDILNKLNEEWNKDNNSGDVSSDSNKTLNTDVSIQIHMDNPKPINQFNNIDTILEDLEKYNEPYYDVQDDIYYDVNDHDASTVDNNNMDIPSKVQIEMDVNTKLVKEKYPIADVWDI
ncbi:erythrocyte membrane protein 1, PfEMP1, putative [Plasmodium sp. gorilla clade G1]|nr:erythrocyte membrane protein 1, PfEMP1, putative [Plasmodium sp. gorilla clade G1]